MIRVCQACGGSGMASYYVEERQYWEAVGDWYCPAVHVRLCRNCNGRGVEGLPEDSFVVTRGQECPLYMWYDGAWCLHPNGYPFPIYLLL
jgi:hypothetical protein